MPAVKLELCGAYVKADSSVAHQALLDHILPPPPKILLKVLKRAKLDRGDLNSANSSRNIGWTICQRKVSLGKSTHA